MKNKIIKTPFALAIILLLSAIKLSAQNDAAAFAAADTSGFSVNSYGGWKLFNSYVAPYNTDSVQLEIIVQHTNNIDLHQEQYIGKLKILNLIPQNSQTLSFNLTINTYTLKVDTQGKCYLRFVAGALPDADKIVIPVKVYFKK